MRNFDIIHRVSKWETLAQVSAMYNVPPFVIAGENDIKEGLYEGQRLVIGTYKGTLYRVKPTDTIDTVSKKFGVPADKILNDNKTGALYPFMDIIIGK